MNILALIALMVLAHVTLTGGRVALTLSAIDLGASPFQVGLLMSLLAVIPMFLSVHAGRWTDRSGVVRPMLMSLCMLAAGPLLPALYPSLNSMYGASVLVGTGFMLTHLAINNAIGHASAPEDRANAFSLLALGFSISTMLGPVIAGFLIEIGGSTWTFAALAVFPMIALAILGMLRKVAPPPPPPVHKGGRVHVIDLFRHVPLRSVFVVSGLLSMGWDLFTFIVPIQGARIGLPASTIGLIMGAFGVGTFMVRMIMQRLSRAFTEWQVLTGALGVTASVYLLFPLFTAVPILLGLAFFLGLGLGSALPMIMSLIYRTAPEGRTGEAVGVRSTLINASQTLLPLLFGAIGSTLGTLPVFWVLALLLFSGVWFARRRDNAG